MVTRRVNRGHEAEYEAWLKGINKAAAAFPGFLGVNVIRPPGGVGREYVSIFRFDSYVHLKRWEESAERRQWLARLGDDMIECEAREQSLTGLEFWFTASALPCLAPPRYKMVIVLVPVIFCMLNLLSPVFSVLLHGVAPLLRSLIVVAAQVTLMTYLIMPLLTRLLSRWLFAQRA